jgi:hypothetical protein
MRIATMRRQKKHEKKVRRAMPGGLFNLRRSLHAQRRTTNSWRGCGD